MTTPASTALADYVEALKREVAVPGEFDGVFPDTSDTDLANSLADAFAQAQLDGFFGTMELNTGTNVVTPGLSSGAGALVIIYAGERIIRAQLRNLKNRQKYEAAGATYEVETSASILTEELKSIQKRKEDLLALILRQSRSGQAVFVSDGYLTRVRGYFPSGYFGEFGSFYGYELAGFGSLNGF